MSHLAKPFTIVAMIVTPICADAQDGARVAAAANALDITEAQFVACIPASATPGERLPQSERRKVLNCLKAANPSLTNGDIRTAMQSLQN